MVFVRFVRFRQSFLDHFIQGDLVMRFLLIGLVGLVFGCGGDDPVSPRQAARAELDKRGIEYTAHAFVDAAGKGRLEVVRLFVESGMSVDATSWGQTALHSAASRGHLSVVEFLVGAGADLEARDDWGQTPRYWAALRGHTDVVEYFDSL